MSSFDSLSSSQKIRASLHRDVRTIGTETCHFLGLEITKPAVEIVAELVYKKLAVYGADLEAFANPKEKRRKTIASKPSETPTSKQRESENLNVKQNDPEPSTSKQNVPESSKQEEKGNEVADFDNMDVDDMIDLTFD
ncbi:hypothetical protein HF086_005866 [Spodoptera exigua]|uniref:Centromere protein S n=1 Tax=Spodoptera exigua TaxID=7107 RepID=A0A922MG10_SPOEX|nr:hypothetical protein HF086_005866 [Spodoptera exigua]